MRSSRGPTRRFVYGGPLAFVVVLAASACGDSEAAAPLPLPSAVTVQATTNADTIRVSWSAATNAVSYRVELAADANITRDSNGAEEVFTGADGVVDGTTYAVTVYAVNAEGATTPSASSPSVTADFFPWDEYFATSLHATGQGKQTFYNASPNGGFQAFTGVAYDEISCRTCHLPEFTGGCSSCHESDTPTFGAEVDANLTGVCGHCHSRQKAEAASYSDVHRDAGMDCMACHTMEDLHGDGHDYPSMLEADAIDANCSQCHTTLADNVYHSIHETTVDCTACHTQSVITCYNCHFQTQVQLDTKKPYGQFKDWNFLVNRNGKVHTANFQSLNDGDKTMVGMAPFYSHTIARNAVKCTSCHGSESVNDWFADKTIDVVTWDDTQGKLLYRKGIIPVPPNYASGGLRFDFVELNEPGGTTWSFLESGADRIQLLYATPLTQAQMDKLR